MFSRCNNPECAAPFEYRKGRFFRFRQSASEKQSSTQSHGVKHFWLCGECLMTHTLEYVEGEVLLLRRNPKETPKETAVRERLPRLLIT
jgi:hypothetical protein